MTEPNDEEQGGSSASEWSDAPPERPSPDERAADVPVAGWIPPDGGGSSGGRRGCLIAVAVIGALLVFGFFGLAFLGSQAESILGGTMAFGTGGSGCSVSGNATSFPASATIHSVAYLERKATTGETITTVVTYPDASTDSSDQTLATTAQCITQDITPGLDPGHYGLEYRVGTEVLSKGGFEITP